MYVLHLSSLDKHRPVETENENGTNLCNVIPVQSNKPRENISSGS